MAYDYKGQVIRRGNGNKRATLALQEMLQAAGMSPGKIDGVFGPQTEKALIAFQQKQGLDYDGIAGPETWAQLGRSAKPMPPDPGSNPRRNLDRGLPDEVPGDEASSPVVVAGAEVPGTNSRHQDVLAEQGVQEVPESVDAQLPPQVTGTDLPPPPTRGINLGGISDGGRLLRSPFDNAGPPPPPQPLQAGAGPGPESSSAPPDAGAAPTVGGGFNPASSDEAQAARQFIAQALAQRNAPPGQGRPSPFDALGGQIPPGMAAPANFSQPGAGVPSPNGMPPWLMDMLRQHMN